MASRLGHKPNPSRSTAKAASVGFDPGKFSSEQFSAGECSRQTYSGREVSPEFAFV